MSNPAEEARQALKVGYVLPYLHALALIEYAEEQEALATTYLTQAKQSAQAYNNLLTAAQNGANEADKLRKEQAKILHDRNQELRRQLWSVTGVAVALIVAVVCLSSALWSVYAS